MMLLLLFLCCCSSTKNEPLEWMYDSTANRHNHQALYAMWNHSLHFSLFHCFRYLWTTLGNHFFFFFGTRTFFCSLLKFFFGKDEKEEVEGKHCFKWKFISFHFMKQQSCSSCWNHLKQHELKLMNFATKVKIVRI